LNLTRAVDAILDEQQTAPENPHLQPGFSEIPFKTSRIVKVSGTEYRSSALPYSLTVAVCAPRKLGR